MSFSDKQTRHLQSCCHSCTMERFS